MEGGLLVFHLPSPALDPRNGAASGVAVGWAPSLGFQSLSLAAWNIPTPADRWKNLAGDVSRVARRGMGGYRLRK